MNNAKQEPFTAHCLFEQSGTFKRAFLKSGIAAKDYDIQNNFGETDNIIDIFSEINKCYAEKKSIFDEIKEDDLIMAFFPCLYFCEASETAFTLYYANYRSLTESQKIKKIIERNKKRAEFFDLFCKLFWIAYEKNKKIIIENPWNGFGFLRKTGALCPPKIIDNDRTRHGDVFRKPTAFWFLNITPKGDFEIIQTPQDKIKTIRKTKSNSNAGV